MDISHNVIDKILIYNTETIFVQKQFECSLKSKNEIGVI